MDLPTEVKIGPHVLPVRELPMSSESYGQFLSYVPSIEIKIEGCSQSMVADTLLHEILHALWFFYKVDLFSKLESDEDREEGACSVLATGLMNVMRDNPDLVYFLLENQDESE